jgi:recombination protein RecA
MAKKKSGTPTGNTANDNFEALQGKLSKLYGESEARPLSSADVLSNVAFSTSSGSIVVDKVLSAGNPRPCTMWPFGRMVEVSGLNGTGKTTLCAQVAAQTQKAGGIVVVVDTEERIAEDWWQTLGVDTSRVINLHANSIEDVFNKQYEAIKMLHEHDPSQPMFLLWDSVGGTSTDLILEGKGTLMERANKVYGKEAKIIGTGLKALNGLVAKTKVAYTWTNHVYTKMGVSFGSKWETYGGEKLKFFATVRLQLGLMKTIWEEDAFGKKQKVGQVVEIKALKNSLGPMQMAKEAYLMGGEGFSNDRTIFEVGKQAGLIQMAGSWGTAHLGGDEVKFQGWKGFREKIIPHPKYPELYAMVLEFL